MKVDGEIIFTNTASGLSTVEVAACSTASIPWRQEGIPPGLSIAKLLTERMGGRIEAEYQHNCVVIRLVFI